MRHLVARRKLNRTSEHREALRRNMAQSLFEHGQIETTLPKAKDLRPFAERLITLARKAHGGSLAARQRLESILCDRAIIPADFRDEYDGMSDAMRNRVLRSRSGRRNRLGQARGGLKFTAVGVLHHLIANVAPRFSDRPGGYTRIIKLGTVRHGDNAPKAVLQLLGEEDVPGNVSRPERSARQRRTERRYAAAAKAVRKRGGPAEKPADEAAPASAETSAPVETPQAEGDSPA